MGEPKGKLVTPVADNPDDELRSLEVDDSDNLKVAEQGTPTVIAKPHADEKLFGLESVINKTKTEGADNTTFTLDSDDVPDGKIWNITHVVCRNEGGVTTLAINMAVNHDGTDVYFHTEWGTTARWIFVEQRINMFLDADDFIRIVFDGCGVGNNCIVNIFGYEMNAPGA